MSKLDEFLSNFLDQLSDLFGERPGLLPLIGLAFILLNWILQLFPQLGWFVTSNFLLHLGLMTSIIGILLIRAL